MRGEGWGVHGEGGAWQKGHVVCMVVGGMHGKRGLCGEGGGGMHGEEGCA